MEQRIALFPGSFDPFTIGHHSIVERALPLFDKIIVAVGVNANKHSFMTEKNRIEAIRAIYAAEPRIEVVSYTGLTVEAAAAHNARFILRGVTDKLRPRRVEPAPSQLQNQPLRTKI